MHRAASPAHFDDAHLRAPSRTRASALSPRWIREDLEYDRRAARTEHARAGPLLDALRAARDRRAASTRCRSCAASIETELNGANDNPLIDPETGDVLHGGNFYGGHVCLRDGRAEDAVANLADLLDRQLALLVQPALQRRPAREPGRGASGPQRAPHHGFKAMQITARRWPPRR